MHTEGRSREQIWDALQRKEVYGTSGDRILLWFHLLNAEGPDGTLGARADGRRSAHDGHAALRGARGRRLRAEAGLPGGDDGRAHAPSASSSCAGANATIPRTSASGSPASRSCASGRRSARTSPLRGLIDDPWQKLACEPSPSGCVVQFEDPDFAAAGRDTVYYVRAIEEPSPAVNAGELRCRTDESGRCIEVHPCYGATTARRRRRLPRDDRRARLVVADLRRPRLSRPEEPPMCAVLTTRIVPSVAPSELRPAQVAREFRRLIQDGAKLRPAGEARRRPSQLLSPRLHAEAQDRALRYALLSDRRAPGFEHPLLRGLRRSGPAAQGKARDPSAHLLQGRFAAMASGLAFHPLGRRELDRQGRRAHGREEWLRGHVVGRGDDGSPARDADGARSADPARRLACAPMPGESRSSCAARRGIASRRTATSRSRGAGRRPTGATSSTAGAASRASPASTTRRRCASSPATSRISRRASSRPRARRAGCTAARSSGFASSRRTGRSSTCSSRRRGMPGSFRRKRRPPSSRATGFARSTWWPTKTSSSPATSITTSTPTRIRRCS